MSNYPHLFSPLTVDGIIFKNRIIGAPLGRGRITEEGNFVPRTLSLLVAKAKGGAAEVAVGETSVDFVHANREAEPTTDYRNHQVPSFFAFQTYAEGIHKHGAIATIELSHVGNARSRLPQSRNPIGPMGFTRADGVVVDGMDSALIEEVVDKFGEAAAFMQAAGFDGVVPHAGHGWLLHQFLSPRTNQRTDRYGGSLENRARLSIEVMQRIRERCGPRFIIEVRVSGDEMADGGMNVEEVGLFCHMLEGIVNTIHVSVGLYHDPVRSHEFSSMYHEHGCNAYLSEAIKRQTKLPVIVVGGINDPGFADSLISNGKADFIALGRQLTADPDWPTKAQTARADDIAKCMRCYCCFPGPKEDVLLKYGTTPKLKCTVNPLNDPYEPVDSIPIPRGHRKVLVIGGGVAGMEAAITAAERGHHVTLVEKTGALGGLLKFADRDSYKKDLREFKELLIRRVRRHKIRVMTGTEATAALIGRFEAEVVIFATGSHPIVPPIKGIENAIHALGVYDDIGRVGKRVVMIGGGLVGCETALHMSHLGRQVVIVEMSDRVAPDAYPMHRVALLEEMEKHTDMTVKTGLKCCEVLPGGISVTGKTGDKQFIAGDSVVYAVGMKANTVPPDLLASARGATVFQVGDCVQAAKVQKAVEEGYLAALKIL